MGTHLYFIIAGECQVIHKLETKRAHSILPSNCKESKHDSSIMLTARTRKQLESPSLSARTHRELKSPFCASGSLTSRMDKNKRNFLNAANHPTDDKSSVSVLIELGVLRPFQFFGELSVLKNIPCSNSVLCKSFVEVWMVAKADLLKFPDHVITALLSYSVFYPTEEIMREHIAEEQSWEKFKKGLLKNIF